jgi:hypothetical protein
MHLDLQRLGIHGACLDKQRDLGPRGGHQLKRKQIGDGLETVKVGAGPLMTPDDLEPGSRETPTQKALAPVYLVKDAPGRAHPSCPEASTTSAGRCNGLGFCDLHAVSIGRMAEREQRAPLRGQGRAQIGKDTIKPAIVEKAGNPPADH